MNLKFCILTIILSLSAVNVRASGMDKYDYFFHIPTQGNEVNSIYRDPSSGIVWLGTSHGLFRYGNCPLNKVSQSIHPDILVNCIKSVQGVGDGTLLLRSISRHYILYNPITNEVRTDFDDIFRQWGLEGAHPWKSGITMGKDGNVWIFSDNSLWCCSLGSPKAALLKAKVDGDILQVYISDDKFYVLTSSKLFCYDKNSSSLLYMADWIYPNDIRELKMVEDKYGNIWVGNENLYKYTVRDAAWTIVQRNLSVTEMVLSKDGDIYIASSSRGIVYYNSAEDRVENIIGNPFEPGSLRSNRLQAILVDNDGNLWVSYSKQDLSVANYSLRDCHARHIESLKRSNISDDIISLVYDNEGTLWMGTDGHGLYNSTKATSKSVIPGKFSHGNNSEDAVTSVFVDSSGHLWVGLYRRGLLRKDKNTWKVYLDGMSPYSIAENSDGNIYVGLLGNGLYCIPNKGEGKPCRVDVNGRQYVMQLFCDNSDTLYVATTLGLYILNTQTNKSEFLTGNRSGTQQFLNHDLQGVYKDSRGLLWIISSRNKNTLSVFDMKSDSIITISGFDNHNIRSIIEDDDHNMWGASDRGIVNIKIVQDSTTGRYSFKTFSYTHRNNEEEVCNYNYRSVVKAPDGTLIFGSTNGYRQVIPLVYENLSSHNSNHKVYLASLKINNEFIGVGATFNGREILANDISATGTIRLKHNENNLSFIVHSQDYGTPFETAYFYNLKGLNEKWMPIENNAIDLSNLPPGNYALSVNGRNSDGSMTETLASLNIDIAAPWYMTTVAYVLYIVLILLAIVSIMHYFTVRQRQNKRLRQAEKEVERQHQLNEVKLRFFTNISHDFRTPLTLIITPLEAYLSTKQEDSDTKFFTSIYKNAVRLLNLIDQVLDFRKLEVYGASLNPSNGDIISFIKDVCSSFTLFAEDSHIDLKFLSEERQFNMMFDKDKLAKIMMNLLSNAFKHTPHGGKVYVRIVKTDSTLQISVIDNGCGIPDNEKSAIFQRFYQNTCDNAANMGCGIGLHIVREFVSLHNGTVEVTDNQPTGAVFTITLPIETISEVKIDSTLVAETDFAVDDEAQLSDIARDVIPTILLVEDNEEFLDFLSNSLSTDYHILCATNGLEALKVIEFSQIDLIVSDVMMDGMDGLKLCELVKTDVRYSHIPVILLTAKSMIEDEIQGFEVGADDYVTKPFNLSILKLRINNLLKDREKSHIKFKAKAEINPSEITITSLDEQFLSQAIAIVEENISNPDFSVEELSDRLGVHRTHLYRKLSGITGKTPIEFIRLIRLKRGRQYLEKSQMYISEIAYAVGFNSPKLFSKYFKMEFNISPKDYVKRREEDG